MIPTNPTPEALTPRAFAGVSAYVNAWHGQPDGRVACREEGGEAMTPRIIAPGHCRYCQCTEDNACKLPSGDTCCWLDRERTVCSNDGCARRSFGGMPTPKPAKNGGISSGGKGGSGPGNDDGFDGIVCQRLGNAIGGCLARCEI